MDDVELRPCATAATGVCSVRVGRELLNRPNRWSESRRCTPSGESILSPPADCGAWARTVEGVKSRRWHLPVRCASSGIELLPSSSPKQKIRSCETRSSLRVLLVAALCDRISFTCCWNTAVMSEFHVRAHSDVGGESVGSVNPPVPPAAPLLLVSQPLPSLTAVVAGCLRPATVRAVHSNLSDVRVTLSIESCESPRLGTCLVIYLF